MFKDFNLTSLKKAASIMHVEYPPGATKAQIRTALIDAGYTEKDYRERLGVKEGYTDLPDQEPVEEAVVEEAETPDLGEPARVWVRFLGRNLSFTNKYGTFSRTEPIFQVNSDTAENLIRESPAKFRLANQQEVSSV